VLGHWKLVEFLEQTTSFRSKYSTTQILGIKCKLQNKEERYSRVPRLSDTHYSAKGSKREILIYGVVWAADRFQSYGRQHISVKIFILPLKL